MARVNRCCDQIWLTAVQVARCGAPVILDLRFTKAQDRRRFAAMAASEGLAARLHFLDVPAEERWRRVQGRNVGKAETYQLPFDVTREMFDFVDSFWEPPSAEEMADLDRLRIPFKA
jgi:predicted kinase